MCNVIRMWNEVNGVLPGISLTMPIFSDGYIDVNPSMIGPKFSLFEESVPLTRPKDDWYNCCYLSFVYIPEKFPEFDREIQPVLSTDVDCLSHYYQQQSDKTGEAESTEFLRAHCTPLPDRYKTLKDSDDLFAKIQHTNVAMRNSLKACNTLWCLTLFKNSYVVLNNPIDYDGNLLILKMICNEEITNWKDLYSSNVLFGLKNLHFSIENRLHCFKNLYLFNQFCKAFLFHSEYAINDSTCMIHKGSKIPGRGSKCSLLLQEFARNGQAQYKVTQGAVELLSMFGSKK